MTDAGLEVPEWQPRDRGDGAHRTRDRSMPRRPAASGHSPGCATRSTRPPRGGAPTSGWRRSHRRSGAPEGAVVAAFERIDIDRLGRHVGDRRRRRRTGPGAVRPRLRAPDSPSGRAPRSWSGPGRSSSRRTCRPASRRIRRRGPVAPSPSSCWACCWPAATGSLPIRSSSTPCPPWLVEEPAAGARAIAEVAVRRALLRGASARLRRTVVAGGAVGAVAVHAGGRRGACRRHRARAPDRRCPARGRDAPGPGRPAPPPTCRPTSPARRCPGRSHGVALDHARGMVAAALVTLERLADDGWRTVAGDPPAGCDRGRARDVVAERTESFDPFRSLMGPRA